MFLEHKKNEKSERTLDRIIPISLKNNDWHHMRFPFLKNYANILNDSVAETLLKSLQNW